MTQQNRNKIKARARRALTKRQAAKTERRLVESPLEAALRARVNRIFTLANKLTGVDWTMVANGTHIALPSITPFATELQHEAGCLIKLLDEAAER